MAIEFYRISKVADPVSAEQALANGIELLDALAKQHKLPEGQQTLPFFLRRELTKLEEPKK